VHRVLLLMLVKTIRPLSDFRKRALFSAGIQIPLPSYGHRRR
jgi:hypothetical protein